MKRLLPLLFCLLLLCSCQLRLEKVEVSRETPPPPPPPQALPQPVSEPEPEPEPEPIPEPTPEELRLLRAEELLAGMTEAQKIGQLFLARCPGPAADGAALMERYQLGGYLLFKRDFQQADGSWSTAEQLSTRLESYQAAAAIPPLLGVDEEGGGVARASLNPNLFPEGRFASPQKLFQTGGLEGIFEDATYKSESLLQYGINLNLAPVADVSTDPADFMYQRAFGQEAAATADYVEAVVSAMERAGMGAVLKHFPGYGSCGDTHTAVVVDDRPWEQFVSADLLPFQAGMTHPNAAVLVSHNRVTCLDKDLPASLSPAAYRVLREDMGFTGVILTDDLAMDAVGAYASDGQAAVMALQAGADLLISSDFQTEWEQVSQALAEGTLTPERVEQSVLRILQWKLLLGIVE